MLLSGATTTTVTTDHTGAFSASVPAGIYRVSVTRSGFTTASVNDITVSADEVLPLTVTMSQADLTSLRTIGTVTATGRGASINTGTATTAFVPAQSFANLANPILNDVLQRTPEVTIQHMGSQPDTTIIVGGSQPYETQVLIDGHPLALGQYGVWTSQFFPSYLVGGIEVQSGPGNTTPFANLAVGGTANILTPAFTRKPTAEFVTGFDNYSSQYSNLLTTGSYDKLSYVLALGTGGQNGRYFKQQGCSVALDGSAATQTGIIQFCSDMSGSLFTRGSALKLKYDFTPQTSFEVGFVGAWGGYSPQGTAWGLSFGPTTIEQCAGTNFCTNPVNANLIGKTINGFQWYPGTFVYNNQDLFDAQFRTAIGNDTLLIRPYLGDIEPEIIDGGNEGKYPSFFGQPAGTAGYQAPSCANGTKIANCPAVANGTGNDFENTACPVGNIFSYSQINSPTNTVTDVNGQQECYQYPYSTFEQDKLYGSTFSYIHPFGGDTGDSTTLTYDFHGQSVFAYFNAPDNISVPLTSTRYSTFSLTSDLKLNDQWRMNLGLYDTHWTVAGVQPLLDNAGAPVLDGFGDPELTGLGIGLSRFDPHVAFTFRPDSATSMRLAWGTSATFPFAGQVSGLASFQPYAQSAPLYTAGVLIEKNPNLQPEVSSSYAIGIDHRFKSNSIVSLDLQNTIIHNVFQSVTSAEPVDASNCPGLPPPCLQGISAPINVARMHNMLATLKYRFAPPVGFGYNIAAAAESAIVSGIPSFAYGSSLGFPANDVQICGSGQVTPGIPTCIPYLKGYGQFTYTWRKGGFAALGVDYEGKNNAYFQPPMALVDLTLRHPITKNIDIQATLENALNTNAYNALPAPGQGTPLTADTSAGQSVYIPVLVPAIPRTVRVQARFHFGR